MQEKSFENFLSLLEGEVAFIVAMTASAKAASTFDPVCQVIKHARRSMNQSEFSSYSFGGLSATNLRSNELC